MPVKKLLSSSAKRKTKIIISDYPKYFVVQKNKQYLYCFGAKHIYDPNHNQFKMIEKLWRKFLVATKKQKRIVLVEGGKRPFIKNRVNAILEGGEAHFIAHLAGMDKIQTDSPEPNDKLERKELLKEFTKEHIQLYYFSRIVYQWNNLTKKTVFKKYMDIFLKNDKRTSGWKNFDFSLSHII